MKGVIKIGRLFYGISIVALGIHQLVIKNFRSEILSPFPAWAHSNIIFPILTGIALIFAGIIISGLFQIKFVNTKKTCLYLGFSFLVALIASHLPYILILSAGKTLGLQPWIDAAEELAYSGGAFVMAGSFSDSINKDENNRFTILLEKLIPFGGIFYSVLMILFGVSHFLFAAFIATLVPKWLPFPMFWTYFFGIALIISGISIIFKIGTKPISLLLAFMLLLFFLFFHIPEAISNPSTGGGNEIVRAFVALLFCGIALGIASTNNPEKRFG